LEWIVETVMREIGALEAENKLNTLLDLVEDGEEIVITRGGKAVARLVRETAKHDRGAARAAAERIRKRAKAINAPAITTKEWRAFRDEGRA
jgi:prevent-host-death family protein